MRLANKELLPQNADCVARPSVLITVKRYMPRGRRYTVSAWSGWPMDNRFYHGSGMSKKDAVMLAKELTLKHLRG